MRRRLAGSLVLLCLGVSSAYAQRTSEAPDSGSASLSSASCPGTGCVNIDVPRQGTIGVQITGTWSGTLTFNGSIDGATFQTLNCTPTNGSTQVTTTTANGVWTCSAAGLRVAQVVFTSYTSGTAVVTLQAAPTGGGSGGGGGGGSDVTIHDPNTVSQKAAINASGQLSVNCANCSGSGVSQQDNTGFTPGTTNMVPIGAEVDDVATTAATENNAGVVRMDTNRSLYVQLRSGSAQTGTSGSPVRTDPTGTTTQPETPKDSGGTSMTDTTAHALKILSVDSTGTVIAPTTLATHDGALTPASTTGGLSMYRASSSAPSAVSTNDDAVLPWADLTGRLHVSGDSAMTALKVDGSGVTQPVSGTVTTTPPANASTNVAQFGGTNVSTGTGAGGAGIPRVTISNDSSLAANQSVNVAQLAGTATSVNSGLKDAGTLRVVLATDQPQLTNKLLVTPDSVALPANQSVNVAQFAGTNAVTGTGTSGAGIPRVTVSSDSTLTSVGSITNTVAVQGTLTHNNAAPSTNNVGVLAARASANAPVVYTEGNQVTGSVDLSGDLRMVLSSPNGTVGTPSSPLFVTTLPGLPSLQRTLVTTVTATQLVSPLGAALGTPSSPLAVAPVTDTAGCAGASVRITTSAAINTASATTTKIISGTSSTTIYLCALDLVVAAADNVALVYGSGATCATGTTGLAGGTTAATGWNFAANGGLTKGNGQGVVWRVPPGNDVCVATSAAVQASGSVTYAQF